MIGDGFKKEFDMCLVCRDWIKGKLTAEEALNNMDELMMEMEEGDLEHYREVAKKILEEV